MGSRIIRMSLLCAAVVSMSSMSCLAQTNLKLLSAWNPNNPIVPRIEAVFIKDVIEASENRIPYHATGARGRADL